MNDRTRRRPTRSRAPHRALGGPLFAALAAATVLLASGCGEDDAAPGATDATHGPSAVDVSASERWVQLTDGYEPDHGALAETDPDQRIALREIAGETWIEIRYRDEDWTPLGLPGVFVARRFAPVLSSSSRARARQAVVADETPLVYRGLSRVIEGGEPIEAASYGLYEDRLFVVLPDGVERPHDVVHLVALPRGAPDGAGWRIDVGHVAGEGFLVLPGQPVERPLGEGTARRLSFTAFAKPPFGDATEPLVFRVLQDGRELWRHELARSAITGTGAIVHGAVDLADTTRDGELELRVDGPFAITGFLAPIVGPQLDPDAATTALDGRPNLVVFLADTFRADNLASLRRFHDSDDALDLPRLEALARRSTSFQRAWSTSSWTLPAHASLFTSLLPEQHAATTAFSSLSDEALTLAEVLRAAGYRTVAVTDGAYVTSSFGLDQGFELFVQGGSTRDDWLAAPRDVLATSDGRPTFLFVQTYATHNPFEPSDEARVLAGLEIGGPGEGDVSGPAAEAVQRARDGAGGDPRDDPAVDTLRRLYRAQVIDFDRALGEWLDAFDTRGWSATSHIFFTSDHGESFGANEWLYHIGPIYETLARIPLLWSGPGVDGGSRDDTTSLVDLAPTLAALAGVAVPRAWIGRDLGATDPTADPRLAWMSWRPANQHGARANERYDGRLAATDGRIKVHFEENGAIARAFDLVADPDEDHPLAVGAKDWPTDVARRASDDVRRAIEALLPGGSVVRPDTDMLERLRELGYLGDEENGNGR
ncbi:sulfatase [Planctomycetes bacterium Pla163]